MFECRANCRAIGCQFVTPIMEAALAVKYMQMHQEDVHTQPAQQEEVDPKPVYTAQPIQQVPGTQQPEYRHSEVVVQDHAASQDQVLLKVVTKQVDAAQPIQQVPGTQQPEYRHEQVMVEDHAASQDQVLLSMGGGHSDDQLPLPTTQPDVCGEGRCITSPRESDNHRQAQSNQRGVTTDPQPEENGTKTATTMAGVGQKIVFLLNILLALLGNGASYNQHTAYLTNQVPYSTVTNVMLPSLSWTDVNTRPHHIKRVRIRDPGLNKGGARHYAAHHYPYQREGRRHRLGPHQQNGHYCCHCVEEETPPQGPYLVGPPEPFPKHPTSRCTSPVSKCMPT